MWRGYDSSMTEFGSDEPQRTPGFGEPYSAPKPPAAPPPPPPPGATQIPPPPPAVVGYEPPPGGGYATAYAEPSQSVTVFVLGLLGLVVCQLLAPVAWYLGNQELAGIGSGRRSAENQGLAKAGQILGIVGTVFVGVILGFVFLFLVIGVAAA